MRRDQLLDQLAARICAIHLPHPVRVAIDGVDAAGKTMLADELAARIAKPVIRASIDGFHRPRAERYRRGKDSPEGYFYDSFDYAAVRRELLEPLQHNRAYRRAVFDFRTDTPRGEPEQIAPTDAVLLFDGVFLLRPELNTCWDFRIFVHADFEITVARAATRDQALFGDQTRARYWTRYVPGQRIYLDTVHPQEIADAVIENSDWANPILTKI